MRLTLLRCGLAAAATALVGFLLLTGCRAEGPGTRYIGAIRDVSRILLEGDADEGERLDELGRYWRDNGQGVSTAIRELGELDADRSLELHDRAERLYGRLDQELRERPELRSAPLVRTVMRRLAP